MPDADPLLTAAQARAEFGLDRDAIDRWRRRGVLTPEGGKWRSPRKPLLYRRSAVWALTAAGRDELTAAKVAAYPVKSWGVREVARAEGVYESTIWARLARHRGRSEAAS